MTVRFSSRAVFAFVTLAVGVATALPVMAPREFDRTARSARGGPQRQGSWDAGPCYGEDHAEPAAVTVSEGMSVASAGRRRSMGLALDVVATQAHGPDACSHDRAVDSPGRRLSREAAAPTGRAPPLA